MLLPGRAGPGGSGFLISEISERNSNYSIRSSEQTGKVLVSDWITNTRYVTNFEKKQYVNTVREKSFVSRKNINVESNYVTLLIDRGQDGGCVSGVPIVTRLARRLF